MKKFVCATALVSVAFLLPFSSASAQPAAKSEPVPTAAKKFFVAISPQGGGKKVKVGKILRMKVRCSMNCKVKVRFKLITPVGASTVKGGRYLPKGVPWQTGMILTNRGRNALKNHVKTSRLVARVVGINSANGKRSVRNKTFKFRR